MRIFGGGGGTRTPKPASDRPTLFKSARLPIITHLQNFCGEDRIRTDGALITLNAFQEHRNQPLCHFSMVAGRHIKWFFQFYLGLPAVPRTLSNEIPKGIIY